MPLLNPNASFDVAAESPTQVVDYTQLSRTIGAYAEDYMSAKASNADASLNSDLLSGLRTVKALRADGKEAEAQAAETNIMTNFIARGGELADPDVQAMSMSIIGKSSEAWGQSQQDYQMNIVRNSPEYMSALTATYATISSDATPEERDAAAFAIIAKTEGNSAIMATGTFEWKAGGRDLFLDSVKSFEDNMIGSVVRAGIEGTPITLEQVNDARNALNVFRTELTARRPAGVSSEDWSVIEDRMKATSDFLDFMSDTKMPEMVNAEVLSNLTEAIRSSDAFSTSRQNALISALNADPSRAMEFALFGDPGQLTRDLASVFDQLPDPRTGLGGTRLSPGQLRDPQVFDLQVSENEKDFTPAQFFEQGRGAFNAANVASGGQIESNVELREEWARMLTKGMARIGELSAKGEFMTADQYEYMFGSEFRHNMNRIKNVDPQLYNALAARAQDALTQAGISLQERMTSGLFAGDSPFEYNAETKTFRITEASARNAMGGLSFSRVKAGVDQYYNGDWDAALADKGQAFKGEGGGGRVAPLYSIWTSYATKSRDGGVPAELSDAANGIDIILRTQTDLNAELGKAAVENFSMSSKNVPSVIDHVAPLTSTMIDRFEGGGDYDTLLSFSNKPGSEFGNTRVSTMTIGEAIAFSASGGEYAEYSKRVRGKSDPATPMGRYQFVGSTLKDIANRHGIDLNTRFDSKTQDALFLLYAKERIGNKTGAAARTALTGVWVGLGKASASDVDQMIAEIRAADVPDLSGGTTPTASSVSTPDVQTSTLGSIDGDYTDLVTSAGLDANTSVKAQFADEAAAQAALDSGQLRPGDIILIGSGDTAQLIEVT